MATGLAHHPGRGCHASLIDEHACKLAQHLQVGWFHSLQYHHLMQQEAWHRSKHVCNRKPHTAAGSRTLQCSITCAVLLLLSKPRAKRLHAKPAPSKHCDALRTAPAGSAQCVTTDNNWQAPVHPTDPTTALNTQSGSPDSLTGSTRSPQQQHTLQCSTLSKLQCTQQSRLATNWPHQLRTAAPPK